MEEIGMQVGGLSAFLLSPPQGQSGIAGGIALLPAPTLSYSKVLIWLHGLGDDAAGWVHVMPTLSLEDTKFILPNAPKRPITAYGGIQMSAWSDIKGCTADAPEDRRGIEESATCIKKLIQAEIDRGISPDRIAVGGFSQGGALALHICLRIGVSLAGCISLSAWLPLRRDYPRALSVAASKSLKILQVHGSADETVPISLGMGSHIIMKSLLQNPAPKFMEIKDMKHCQHPTQLAAIRYFINEELGFYFMK